MHASVHRKQDLEELSASVMIEVAVLGHVRSCFPYMAGGTIDLLTIVDDAQRICSEVWHLASFSALTSHDTVSLAIMIRVTETAVRPMVVSVNSHDLWRAAMNWIRNPIAMAQSDTVRPNAHIRASLVSAGRGSVAKYS